MFKWVLPVLILTGCSSITKKQESAIDLGQEVSLTLPARGRLIPIVTVEQLLTMEFAGSKRNHHVVLKSTAESLDMVALLPLGGELFSAKYSHHEFKIKSLPVGIKSEDLKYALGDIVLIYASQEDLQKWLSPNVVIRESLNKRELRQNNDVIISIEYNRPERFNADVVYENKIRKYKLLVKPLTKR